MMVNAKDPRGIWKGRFSEKIAKILKYYSLFKKN